MNDQGYNKNQKIKDKVNNQSHNKNQQDRSVDRHNKSNQNNRHEDHRNKDKHDRSEQKTVNSIELTVFNNKTIDKSIKLYYINSCLLMNVI